MNSKTKIKVIAFCAAALFTCVTAQAQRWESRSNPQNTNDPLAIAADPSFCYDPDSGFIYIQNSGPNGTVDSAADGSFGDDDYPMISALISFPGTLNTGMDNNNDGIVDPTAVLPLFDSAANVAWSAPILFNGQFQLTGNAVAAPGALTINEAQTAIMQIDTGLSAADFGSVSIETGYSYAFAAGSGGTLFSTGDALATGAFHIGGCLANNFEDGISSDAGSTNDFFDMFGDDPRLAAINSTEDFPEGATLFVPTDAAIAAAADIGRTWTLEDLIVIDSQSGNPSGAIVSNTPGYNEADLNSLVAGGPQTVTALSGNDFDLEDGSILYGGATVVDTDFDVDNGWIHVIDAIPVPEPGAMTLLAMALVGFVGMRRRK